MALKMEVSGPGLRFGSFHRFSKDAWAGWPAPSVHPRPNIVRCGPDPGFRMGTVLTLGGSGQGSFLSECSIDLEARDRFT